MDFERIKIANSKKQSWEWPLKVGVEKGGDFLKIDLSQPHFVSDFTDVNTVSASIKKSKHYNLLIFDSFKDAVKILSGNQPITADVIIIREDEDFFQDPEVLKPIDKLTRQWSKKTGTGGVFYIRNDFPVGEWYTGLLRELSHNSGIVEAARQNENAVLRAYLTNNLDEETKLSNYIKKFTRNIIKDPDWEGPGRGTRTSLSPTRHPRNPSSGNRFLGPSFKYGKTARNLKLASIHFNKNAEALIYNRESDSAKEFLEFVKAVDKFRSKNKARSIKKASRKSAAAPVSPEARSPRYLRAAVTEHNSATPIHDYLLPGNKYKMRLSIGGSSNEWTLTVEAFPDAGIFADNDLQRVNIDLAIFTNLKKEPVYKRIILPRTGDSDAVFFGFSSGMKEDVFEADIKVYYQNKLIQQAVYKIAVLRPGNVPLFQKPDFKTIVSIRKDFDNLSHGTAFAASILIPEDKPKPGEAGTNTFLTGVNTGKPQKVRYSDSLKRLVENIKQILEQGALLADRTTIDAPENAKLLIALAKQGHALFKNFLNKFSPDGPLQLLSNRIEYLPLDFAYVRNPPTQNSCLCKNAKSALYSGSCCGQYDDDDDQYDVVCPFGFWGIRHIVERHQLPTGMNDQDSDFLLKFEPDTSRPALSVLNRIQYASTLRVDAEIPGSYALMQQALAECASTPPFEIKSWDDWLAKTAATNPDTIVLVVHIETDPDSFENLLEISNEDFLEQSQFDERYLNVAVDRPLPLAILIGCESTDSKAYLFDVVNSAQKSGAAIVLSNFTKITGEMATEIVSKLVRILRKSSGREMKLGEAVLKLRQQLLAEGLMLSLTLLAHGDADWKIKV